ncbi:lytic murein transglycosylase [Mesorhizobium erdmanii]|uniref:Lytic murein transglycosylase n=1 Tax=Mesorhizobium erdmanii TaxID=1777866 RepID=A0A6M7UKQ8_9HYPH|nr:lytic murein transglycosylase [Mesorhizobium erdmanii]
MGLLAFRGAPLCPAGRLPHKGGDWLSPPISQMSCIARMSARDEAANLPPLVGEMPGRAEGGAVPPSFPTTSRELQ